MTARVDRGGATAPVHRGVALAVLCLAAFTINLDTTIVNIALPSLVRQLDASTRELQWIVDAYTLTFAAFVLAAGSLSDRYGRKGALLIGLAVFGCATTVGGLVDSPGALIAVRAVMGVGAAVIFPATLSIISNLYTERGERARAIGLWGAMTGLGVALGPISGGWLLEHFWWGSVFVAMAPVAAVTFLGATLFVPTSRDPSTPPVDVGGLVLSTLAIGTLVFTIIEAPDRGWTGTATIVGFTFAAAAAAVFIAWERRRPHPMLDVSLFRNLRFSAASGSIMVIFFALAGFIFLITQYFQFLKGYAPLSTGVRILPVAICIAIGSLVGVRLSVAIGNKAVVATGLFLVGVSFAWVSTASAASPYGEIVGQMVLAGLGMGLTTAPATEGDHGRGSQREGRDRFRCQRCHSRARRHARGRHHRQRLRLPLRVGNPRRSRLASPTGSQRRQRIHRRRPRHLQPVGCGRSGAARDLPGSVLRRVPDRLPGRRGRPLRRRHRRRPFPPLPPHTHHRAGTRGRARTRSRNRGRRGRRGSTRLLLGPGADLFTGDRLLTALGVNGPAASGSPRSRHSTASFRRSVRRRGGRLLLEDDDGNPAFGETAVLVESGVEACEFSPDHFVLRVGGSPSAHRVTGAVGEDLGDGVRLQVEPPGRHPIAPRVRCDDRIAIAKAEIAKRRRASLAGPATDGSEDEKMHASGEDE
jgi:EmrB/QacA subfamily drug resistance transporter